MPHIISASRRTDIPAFYSEWLMNRIRAGYCRVINPLYPDQKTNPVDLSPDAVECLVFWTRNPKPLMRHLDELDRLGYAYYFLYTLIGYPALFDPGSPPAEDAVRTFQTLSRRLGSDRVIWRYDPVILTNLTTVEWHQRQIAHLARALSGLTTKMIFSFLIDYAHAKPRYERVKARGVKFCDKASGPGHQEMLARWIGKALPDFGITPVICADRRDFSAFGIERARCIDRDLINRLSGRRRAYRKDPAQRADCCCAASRDIGANNTCQARCFYCYAVKDGETAARQFARHDPEGEYLIAPEV